MKKQKRYLIYGPDIFYNFPFGKSDFKKLVHNITITFSQSEALALLELIKSLGFQTSTRASFSISLEDVKEVPIHNNIIHSTMALIHSTERQFTLGQISESERFQQSIDLWNNVTSYLRTEILIAFQGVNRLNSIYMMAFSGARGNLNQVRQLVALRGLIADPLGRVLDVPIRSNLNEGLSLTEYLISCYGSRKGVVDTAIRTAQAGYLTRRLVEVGQLILIRTHDCQTRNFIILHSLTDSQGTVIVPLYARSLGRTLATNIDSLNLSKNVIIGWEQQYLIKKNKLNEINIRSPLSCENLNGICQRCYGWNLSNYDIVTLGEAVGVLAAQAIGEPGTQLTMRTFHTGGAFSGEASDFILASQSGVLKYKVKPKGYFVHTRWGNVALFTQTFGVILINSTHRIDIPINTILFVREGSSVIQGQVLGERLAQFTSEETLNSTQERKIYSFCDGQIMYGQHLLTDQQRYQGMSVVQGSYLGNQFIPKLRFGGWFSIGDHFYNFTFFNPVFYRTTQPGIVVNNSLKKKKKLFSSYNYEVISTGFFLPTQFICFYINPTLKKANIIWSENENYLFQHLTNLLKTNQSSLVVQPIFNCFNFMFETAVQLNLLSKQINTPRSYIIAFLYLPKFFTKTKFIVLTSKTDKTFYIKVLTQFLKNWKLRNFLHNNYHNNYFLPGYPGITYIKKAKPFNDLTILRFKNLLYPSQNFLPENKIQHINGWVFKTRRPLDRIYGWSTYLSKNLYLKPLSVTLNLNSIKSIKWSLFKSFKKILYSSTYYCNKFMNTRTKVIMPRLFGFEFPEHQLDYYTLLLNSRFYLRFGLNYFNYSKYNFDLLNKNFPEVQFYFLAFSKKINLQISPAKPTHLNNTKWHKLFSFQVCLNILNLKHSKIQVLLNYGKTLTFGTPIAWINASCVNGGELNFYKKTTNLINYSHLFSYHIKKDQNRQMGKSR